MWASIMGNGKKKRNKKRMKQMNWMQNERRETNVLITTINASMSQSTFSYLHVYSMDNLFSQRVWDDFFSIISLSAHKRFLILKLLCFSPFHRLLSAIDIEHQLSLYYLNAQIKQQSLLFELFRLTWISYWYANRNRMSFASVLFKQWNKLLEFDPFGWPFEMIRLPTHCCQLDSCVHSKSFASS